MLRPWLRVARMSELGGGVDCRWVFNCFMPLGVTNLPTSIIYSIIFVGKSRIRYDEDVQIIQLHSSQERLSYFSELNK